MASDGVSQTDTTTIERLLWDFVSAYDVAFERAAEANALSAAQACTLTALTRRRWSMRALAEELCCDASNVTQVIGRLEARGLCVREPDPDDRRVRQVAITQSGREACQHFERDFTFPRAALARLTPEEREQLQTLLARMTA